MTTEDIILTARAKAFSTEGARQYSFSVDARTAEVRVYDSIAGHYTTCHALPPRVVKKIQKLASAKLERKQR